MNDDKKNTDELYSVEPTDDEDPYAREMTLKPTSADDEPKIFDEPRPRTFHSKKSLGEENILDEQPRKRRFSHAETSGVAISAVMLVYSLYTADKPLFFLSTSLLTFLLRPLIGGLFGRHSRAVQNALHSFSVVLFLGALIMLFL